MVNKKYPNPTTKRAALQAMNCLLGIRIKTGKPSSPIFDICAFKQD